jgi:hypothetical protein
MIPAPSQLGTWSNNTSLVSVLYQFKYPGYTRLILAKKIVLYLDQAGMMSLWKKKCTQYQDQACMKLLKKVPNSKDHTGTKVPENE